MSYTQSQIQQGKQSQIELEQNYTVMKDLSNVLGILVEYLAVKEDGNVRLTAVFFNRFITQINISNAVHYETFCEAKSTKKESNLNLRKDEAESIFQEVLENLKQQKILKEGDSELQKLLEIYLKVNLSRTEIKLLQYQNLPSQENQQLNEQTLQKIVNAMNQTDNAFANVQNGGINIKNAKDQKNMIQAEVIQRYNNAQQRLKQISGQINQVNENKVNNNPEAPNQLSAETKSLIQVIIHNLYEITQFYSRDNIYSQLKSIVSSKQLTVQNELAQIIQQLKSDQLKQNFKEFQEILKGGRYSKNLITFMNDQIDLPYLQQILNGMSIINQ